MTCVWEESKKHIGAEGFTVGKNCSAAYAYLNGIYVWERADSNYVGKWSTLRHHSSVVHSPIYVSLWWSFVSHTSWYVIFNIHFSQHSNDRNLDTMRCMCEILSLEIAALQWRKLSHHVNHGDRVISLFYTETDEKNNHIIKWQKYKVSNTEWQHLTNHVTVLNCVNHFSCHLVVLSSYTQVTLLWVL